MQWKSGLIRGDLSSGRQFILLSLYLKTGLIRGTGDYCTYLTFVLQALQYLKKVCNHPSLVLTPSHPKYKEISTQLKQQNSSLHDLQHTPKLMALK